MKANLLAISQPPRLNNIALGGSCGSQRDLAPALRVVDTLAIISRRDKRMPDSRSGNICAALGATASVRIYPASRVHWDRTAHSVFSPFSHPSGVR
jgi:hypothetical protein